MSEPITVSFTLRQGDQMDAMWFTLFRGRLGVIFGILLFPSLFAFAFFHQMNPDADPSLRSKILIWPALVIVLLIASILLQRRRFARGDESFRYPMIYSFSSSGVDVQGRNFSGHRDWDGIRRAAQTGRLYLLFISPYQTYIVPKSAFADEPQRTAFVALVREKLGKRAKLAA